MFVVQDIDSTHFQYDNNHILQKEIRYYNKATTIITSYENDRPIYSETQICSQDSQDTIFWRETFHYDGDKLFPDRTVTTRPNGSTEERIMIVTYY